MDFNSLKEQVASISLYDIKAGVRKVQNGERASSMPRCWANVQIRSIAKNVFKQPS